MKDHPANEHDRRAVAMTSTALAMLSLDQVIPQVRKGRYEDATRILDAAAREIRKAKRVLSLPVMKRVSS